MRFWAGVTDNAWFNFLSQSAPDEVNFWQPRGAATYAASVFDAGPISFSNIS